MNRTASRRTPAVAATSAGRNGSGSVPNGMRFTQEARGSRASTASSAPTNAARFVVSTPNRMGSSIECELSSTNATCSDSSGRSRR